MNPSKRGIGTAVKAGAVVLLIMLGLATIYLLPKLSSSSQSQGPTSNPGAQPITGMPSLFYDFTRMSLSVDINDPADGYVQNESFTYSVLGKSTLNSTDYTRVEFSTVGEGNNIVIWYGPTGGIGEVDVVGVRNYTGNGTVNLPFITTYTQSFGALVSTNNNSTLISLLTKTSEVLTSIGPTKMDVTTYLLPGRSYPYTALTLKLATIPGTTAELATYLDEKTSDGSTSILQVTSLTR